MNDDPMSQSHRALNATYRHLLESQRSLEKKMVRVPAAPISDEPGEVFATKPVPREVRRREYLQRLHDPALIEAMIDQETARFKLRPGQLPRNVVDYLLEGHREFGDA